MDWVCITFPGEFASSLLQAATLQRFLRREEPVHIIVSETIPEGDPTLAVFSEAVRELLPRSQMHHANEFMDNEKTWDGYRAQQFLKLACFRVVSSPQYVVLDAKNFAIRPLMTRNYISADGHTLNSFERLEADWIDRYLLSRSLVTTGELLPIDDADRVRSAYLRFPQPVTPFALSTADSEGLARHLSQIEGASLEEVFTDPTYEPITEFVLYWAFVEHFADVKPVETARRWATLWAVTHDPLSHARHAIAADHIDFFSVHRGIFAQFPPPNGARDAFVSVATAMWGSRVDDGGQLYDAMSLYTRQPSAEALTTVAQATLGLSSDWTDGHRA